MFSSSCTSTTNVNYLRSLKMPGSGAPKKAKYLMLSDEVVSLEKVFVETIG